MFTEHAEVVGSSNNRETWLASRRLGIGASEVASVLGCGFMTPAELWALKTGHSNGADLDDVERIQWGNRLEPVVIAAFADARYAGRPSSRAGQLLRSKAHPWALATLDATTLHPVHGWIPLEVKTSSAFAADDWSDGAPEVYRLQCHAQMLVTGAPCASIACLIGGQQFVWCDVERDEATIARIVFECSRFWGLVESGDMPTNDATPEWARVFALVNPEAEGTTVELDESYRDLAAELDATNEKIKALEKQAQRLKNDLLTAIGTASEARFSDGSGFTYRTQVRAEHTVKASTFRVLRASAAPKREKKGWAA